MAIKEADVRWWTLEGSSMLLALQSTVDELDTVSGPRLDAWARYMEAYGIELPQSMTAARRNAQYRVQDEEVLAPNQFRRVLDTVHAKVIRNKVLPQAVSTGGNYGKRARAKALSLFFEGLFATERVDELANLLKRDELLCGLAAVKVSGGLDRGRGRVMFDRVKPWCLRLREAECNGGMPRRLYYVDAFDRGVLAEMFPEKESEIMLAPSVKPGTTARLYDVIDPNAVRVVEAWAVGTEEQPGRHVIAIVGGKSVELLNEEWNEDTFPIAVLRSYVPTVGFYPVPLAKMLLPIQKELEFTAAKIQATFRLMSHAHFIVPPGAEVTTEQITNEPGTIWRAKGGEIQAFAPNTVAADLYRYYQDLTPLMVQVSGASMMSVQNQKPGGVTSGIALQTLDDVEAEGFLAQHRAWQDFHVELAKLAVRAAAVAAEEDPSFSVRVVGRSRAEEVRWRDVAMGEDEYAIRVMPISQFARDFAARIDQAEKLLQLGALSVPQFRDVLDLPDLQAESDLDLSDVHIIDRNIDAILSRQIPVIAEPFDNLEMIVSRGAKAYNLARLENADPVALELLRRYIQSAQDLVAAAQPPAPPPGLAPAPGGAGLPPELASMGQPAPALA